MESTDLDMTTSAVGDRPVPVPHRYYEPNRRRSTRSVEDVDVEERTPIHPSVDPPGSRARCTWQRTHRPTPVARRGTHHPQQAPKPTIRNLAPNNITGQPSDAPCGPQVIPEGGRDAR